MSWRISIGSRSGYISSNILESLLSLLEWCGTKHLNLQQSTATISWRYGYRKRRKIYHTESGKHKDHISQREDDISIFTSRPSNGITDELRGKQVINPNGSGNTERSRQQQRILDYEQGSKDSSKTRGSNSTRNTKGGSNETKMVVVAIVAVVVIVVIEVVAVGENERPPQALKTCQLLLTSRHCYAGKYLQMPRRVLLSYRIINNNIINISGFVCNCHGVNPQ